jgi:uncharacterized membrane protein
MSGVVRWSRFAFNIAAWLFVACVAYQVYLAGQAVFQTASFDPHREFGYLFGLLTLVLIVLAVIGRTGRRVIGASALLIVLFAMQSVFVAFKTSSPAFAALHPLNGFVIGLVAVGLAWQTRGYLRAPRVQPGASSAAAAETKPA